ncbi:phosphoribosyl 1,2-cyclic phosphate phosphodiesterase [Methylobacillus rhizosphaerae]|uniref:Phosphoribosyl 1,2-cyclic phosphate phosphodiesterase n=1 Tax=Methylobacillus rhizosphaerae TaxID=551994 RepID=A0A238ZMV7_9PROT|nr:MBL fold metallo-hydrolase [Methylobacillus rhizosphaerae]SNR84776.1 phosphoribosyl 1,2-cyclic phosphate phosphodiesterase [Methylobacillus rhizosphaerae]
MQLTMLGVGSSAGTPVIACQCATCLSDNPRNKRTRCSSLITLDNGKNILIDTGPDIRQQALREGITHVDAVLYTHTHADHMHGIDDLRAFCQRQRQQIPLYGRPDAMEHIVSKFGYTIREAGDYWDLPILSVNPVEQAFELFGTQILPVPIMHGRLAMYGYRVGKLAYLTDASEIPPSSMALLEDLDVLLLDCLRYTPHYTHFSLEQALEQAAIIGAKQTYLIHMTHEMEYETVSKMLPSSVQVGYDGLKLEIADF